VVVAPNWLGDAVMALPAIADLRRARPDASIAVAARASVAPLFTLTPEADEVVTLTDDRPSALAGREALLLLPNSFQSALTAKSAGDSVLVLQAEDSPVHITHPTAPFRHS